MHAVGLGAMERHLVPRPTVGRIGVIVDLVVVRIEMNHGTAISDFGGARGGEAVQIIQA
jgi:hypothetical protein